MRHLVRIFKTRPRQGSARPARFLIISSGWITSTVFLTIAAVDTPVGKRRDEVLRATAPGAKLLSFVGTVAQA